ncbi:hypothetical protein ES702_07092 [subsurface metagenome]
MNDKNDWKPSNKQALFINLYIDITNKLNIAQICKKVGISRQTSWLWFKNSDFTDYLNSKRNEILARTQTARMLVATTKALSGNFQCLKMLFEIEGIYTPKMRTQADITVGHSKETRGDLVKELKREIDTIAERLEKTEKLRKEKLKTKKLKNEKLKIEKS